MSDTGRGTRVRRWLVAIVAGVVTFGLVLAALVAFVAPGVVRTQAAKAVAAATGRTLAIGSLAIHPFSWSVEIGDVTISEPGGTGRFASFEKGAVKVRPSSLLRGSPVITGIRLVRPHLHVVHTGPNTYNVDDLLPYLEMPVPVLSLEDVAITQGSIDFVDRALPKEETHTLRDVEIVFSFLTTDPRRSAEEGNPKLRAVVDGAPLVVDARVRGLPRAPQLAATLNLKDLSLPVYLPYLPARLPVDVTSGNLSVEGSVTWGITEAGGGELGWDGRVSVNRIAIAGRKGPTKLSVGEIQVRSRVTLGAKRGLRLEEGSVALHDLTLPFGGADALQVGLLELTGARFPDGAGALDVGSVLLEGGRLRVSRDARGTFSPEPFLRQLSRSLPRGKPSPGPEMAWRVARLEGRGIDLLVVDRSIRTSPTFSLSRVAFEARDLAGPTLAPFAVRLEAHVGKKGTLQASGRVTPRPLALEGKLQAKDLSLVDGGFWIPRELRAGIAGGEVSVDARASLAARGKQLTGSVTGSVAVHAPQLVDRKGDRFLSWNALEITGARWDLAPWRLRANRIALSGLRAVVETDADGNLVLPFTLPAASGKSSAPPPGRAPAGPDIGSLQVDELDVSNAAVTFKDRSVRGGFDGGVTGLSVRLRQFAGAPTSVAQVDVEGSLPRGGSLRVAGKVAAFRRPMVADLRLGIDALDLVTTSPYSETYLGLPIEKGALTLDSSAKLAEGRLSTENRVRIDGLGFGKSVKSDKATGLPVALIVDLLRDRDGNVVLDLPFAAQTGDGVGTIIRQLVKDVLFPPSSPLQVVEFEACSFELGAGAKRQLARLRDQLQERPAVKLDAVGYADRDVDENACRARAAAAKGTDGRPDPLAAPTGDRLETLASLRAREVRSFLLDRTSIEPGRVVARTGDSGAPTMEGGRNGARVEFTPQEW